MPNFEFGVDHVIMFGGRGNDSYSLDGLSRPRDRLQYRQSHFGANTHSQAGIWLKIRFPELRGLLVYQEMLGDDNLTAEIPASAVSTVPGVSYRGGLYLPYVTSDGRTDLRFEYAILEPNYATHGDSLYWTNNGNLMGDPMGPNASEIDLQLGRWLRKDLKLSGDLFLTDRAPTIGGNTPYPASIYGSNLTKERSGGVAFDVLSIPAEVSKTIPGLARVTIPLLGKASIPALGLARAEFRLSMLTI